MEPQVVAVGTRGKQVSTGVKELLSVLNPKEMLADVGDDLGKVKTLVHQTGDHEYDLTSAVREGLGKNTLAKLLNTTDTTVDMMRSTRTISGVISSTGIVLNRTVDVAVKIYDINTALTPDSGHHE